VTPSLIEWLYGALALALVGVVVFAMMLVLG
jgi:hypothetical protein